MSDEIMNDRIILQVEALSRLRAEKNENKRSRPMIGSLLD